MEENLDPAYLDPLYWSMVNDGILEIPENVEEKYREFLASIS